MSTPALLDLAPEIVQHVIKQVGNKKDLSNARLTSKTMNDYAAKELFKDVFVSPSDQDIDIWNKIGQNDAIRQMPRHAIIHTKPDIEERGGVGYYKEEEDEEISEEFKSAVEALSRFPNLDSVEIGFTPECLGVDKSYWQEVSQEIGDRVELLELIFQAIKDRAANSKNRTIRKLTIVNLQNCPIEDFTSSDLFQDVMRDLEELHVSLIQEYNEAGPDHDYESVELKVFPAHFISCWLEPISPNLKALSIYAESDNWGPCTYA